MLDIDLKKIASIFEAMVDAVYVVDADLNVEYMNKVMIKRFGEGIGKKCYQIVQKRDDKCPWCRASEVFRGESVRWEQYVSNQDRTYDLIEFPLEDSEGSTSKVTIFRDITKRK